MVLGPCPPTATPKAVHEYDVDCSDLHGPMNHLQAEGVRIGGSIGIAQRPASDAGRAGALSIESTRAERLGAR
jgi:hypothetical protein